MAEKKKKVSAKDFDFLAEYIYEEYKRRKKKREGLDRAIKEIDRQIDMRPNTSYKMVFANGQNTGVVDQRKAWMPEVELPLQAEALETLTSDVRGMIFPDTGPWFAAHSALTDEYLNRADFTSIIAGDENDVPTKINQDNADKLVVGQIEHWHNQYDFRGNIDLINAESLSYGVGVGRARLVKKSVVMDTARGRVKREQKIPILIPRSLKETYLDDREHILQHEGYMVGPLQIFTRKMALSDLKRQAKGNKDPKAEDGGWIPRFVNKLDPDDKGNVELIEAEGDFIIPRSSGSLNLPNTIVTIAAGKNDNKVVRIRFRKHSFNSTIVFPYHQERIGTPYATSPLRKGLPLQVVATELWMQMIMSAQLKNQPPISWDRNDIPFASDGGPNVFPGALWGTISDIKPHDIGDVGAIAASVQQALNHYADVVGVHRARLGAQTVSHTTAFAKNAELQRGAVRTVDYAKSILQGPLQQWLHIAYTIGKENLKENMFYVDGYRGFVEIEKDQLPDDVIFEAHGSGAPADEVARQQQKMAALSEAMQMDQLGVSQGLPPILNMKAMIEERLRTGGFVDIDPFINQGEEELGASPEFTGSVNQLAELESAG